MTWREVRPRIMASAQPNYVAAENLLQPNPALGAENERGAISQQFHPPPSPRHSHAAVVHRNSMYVFGGYDGSYRSDFHKFDFEQLAWRPVVSYENSIRLSNK
jgi:hypothetical protein